MLLFISSNIYEILYKNLVRKFGIFYMKNGLGLVDFVDIVISKRIVKEVDVTSNSNLPSKPVENGGFINDSRFNEPSTINFVIMIKAYEFEIGNIIEKIDQAKKGIDLFNIVIPSRSYQNMALKAYSYSYNATKNFLTVPLEFIEIVITVPKYSIIDIPKNPINENTNNGGRVQAENVTEEQKKSLAVKFFGGGK
ncbi:MAG: phage baseplate protein [Cetobacterium sp.]